MHAAYIHTHKYIRTYIHKLIIIVLHYFYTKVNDELNSMYIDAKSSSAPRPAAASSASTTAGALFKNLGREKYSFSVEDIIRRVEDMARLHA